MSFSCGPGGQTGGAGPQDRHREQGLICTPALPLAGVTVDRMLRLGHYFSPPYDTEMDYGIPKVLSSGDIPPNNKLLSR